MKTNTSPVHFPGVIGLGILFGLAAAPLLAADATPHPAGPPKVRVMVKENNVMTKPGGTTAAATPAPAAGAKGGQQKAAGAAQAESPLDAEKFTHTTKKTLTVDVVNLTAASMDVNVKTTFLAKDEAGKHEVLPEKTVDNRLTLEPSKSGEFTTEEVSFSHTAAHRESAARAGAGGAGGWRHGRWKGKIAPMVPASGHAYVGYKVEVFQGPDLVGSAVSETH